MDWKPRDWTWTPRIDVGLGWLARTLPMALIFPLYALLNIDRWEFRRLWGRIKAYTSSYYFIALVVIAVFAAPLWLDLVYRVRTDLFALFDAGPASGENGVSDVSGHYQTIAILIGVLAALFTAPLALLKAYINERQTNAAEEGLITDRFTKAVEQLGAEKTIRRREFRPKYQVDDDGNWLRDDDGNPIAATRPDDEPLGDWETAEETLPNLEVRLGAIYALERIAQDSERDHIPIMETLCAYIRQNAPAGEAKAPPFDEWEPLKDDPTEDERAAHIQRRNERFGDFFPQSIAYRWARGLTTPRVDIQAALTVIGRRLEERIAHERRQTRGEPGSQDGFHLDLRGANLQRADLTGLNLARALLTETRLEGADLTEARLEGADLTEARLEGASLRGARLEGADLTEARLEGADLGRARLEGANLGRARLEGADLMGANLKSTDLRDWSCARTSLRSVDFSEAKHVTQEDVNGAFGDAATILPDQIERPDHWDEETLEVWNEDLKYQAWLDAGAPPGKPREPAPEGEG